MLKEAHLQVKPRREEQNGETVQILLAGSELLNSVAPEAQYSCIFVAGLQGPMNSFPHFFSFLSLEPTE